MRKDPATLGIYKRGNIYWLAYQKNRLRSHVSLETSDYGLAIERAKEMRSAPELNQGGLLRAEFERCLDYKLKKGEFVRETAANAKNFLDHLSRTLGDVTPASVTVDDATRFYTNLRARMT